MLNNGLLILRLVLINGHLVCLTRRLLLNALVLDNNRSRIIRTLYLTRCNYVDLLCLA